jgi:hypothetical protein
VQANEIAPAMVTQYNSWEGKKDEARMGLSIFSLALSFPFFIIIFVERKLLSGQAGCPYLECFFHSIFSFPKFIFLGNILHH